MRDLKRFKCNNRIQLKAQVSKPPAPENIGKLACGFIHRVQCFRCIYPAVVLAASDAWLGKAPIYACITLGEIRE